MTSTDPISVYLESFCQRRDVYALQTSTGRYFLKQAPVTTAVVRAHLRGQLTAGWYALGTDNRVRWVCLDADQADGLEQLQGAWRQLQARGILSHLELSRRGGHLWVFFDLTPASLARRFVLAGLTGLEGVEVYPKRDQLDPNTRVGTLVRGPLGIHRLSGKRYPFVDPVSLTPVAATVLGTISYLAEAERVSSERVEVELATIAIEPIKSPPRPWTSSPRRSTRQHSIAALKERLGDPYEFIRAYVDLDERGRGHCPFHPPDRHPSFAVNRAGGYWTCFHEVNPRTGRYLGGDVIEFYKRLRGVSYAEVLRELS